jgi:DNA-directed RNA polymerase subunit RPC12/RpoP
MFRKQQAALELMLTARYRCCRCAHEWGGLPGPFANAAKTLPNMCPQCWSPLLEWVDWEAWDARHMERKTLLLGAARVRLAA